MKRVWAGCGLVTALFTSAIEAQVAPCDPQLIQPPGNPLGYRLRGDRCEGIYVPSESMLRCLAVGPHGQHSACLASMVIDQRLRTRCVNQQVGFRFRPGTQTN